MKWESHREEALRACKDWEMLPKTVTLALRGGRCQEAESSRQGRKQCSQEGEAAGTWHVAGNPSEGACGVVFLQETNQPEAGHGGARMPRCELHAKGGGRP